MNIHHAILIAGAARSHLVHHALLQAALASKPRSIEFTAEPLVLDRNSLVLIDSIPEPKRPSLQEQMDDVKNRYVIQDISNCDAYADFMAEEPQHKGPAEWGAQRARNRRRKR
jgi:hypothetical protein